MSDTYVTMYIQSEEQEEALCLTTEGEWVPESILDSWFSFKFEKANGDFKNG